MTRQLTIGDGIGDYYRLHARIYDQSRWLFLFGRRELVRRAAAGSPPARVLEIGCGTGTNLVQLKNLLPGAELHGLDLSADMLDRARRRLDPAVNLRQQAYDQPLTRARAEPGFDLILTSYTLSMINPGWEAAIDHMATDLAAGGRVALVDFHDSPSHLFRHWMAMNHVRMGGHLLRRLNTRFYPQQLHLRRAYAGLWRYSLFIGNLQTAP